MFTLENVAIGGSIVYIIKYNHFPIEDFFQILHPVEQVRLQTFASEKRRTEYIATRILKDTIFPGALIDYNKEGAPFIEHAPHLSVSHCKGASAIAVCPDHIVGLAVHNLERDGLDEQHGGDGSDGNHPRTRLDRGGDEGRPLADLHACRRDGAGDCGDASGSAVR